MREIPRDIADAEGVPEDLDSGVVGPYTIPSTRRRLRSGVVYAVGAVAAAAGAIAGLPSGLWLMAVALAAIAIYHAVAAWRLEVADVEALETANRSVRFAVGHASAGVGFDGWRARPVWNVLVFSAEDPPAHQGLVRVDGVDGKVIDTYVEPVPPQS